MIFRGRSRTRICDDPALMVLRAPHHVDRGPWNLAPDLAEVSRPMTRRAPGLFLIVGGAIMTSLWPLFTSLHGPTSYNEERHFLGQDPLFWGAMTEGVPSLLIAAGLALLAGPLARSPACRPDRLHAPARVAGGSRGDRPSHPRDRASAALPTRGRRPGVAGVGRSGASGMGARSPGGHGRAAAPGTDARASWDPPVAPRAVVPLVAGPDASQFLFWRG